MMGGIIITSICMLLVQETIGRSMGRLKCIWQPHYQQDKCGQPRVIEFLDVNLQSIKRLSAAPSWDEHSQNATMLKVYVTNTSNIPEGTSWLSSWSQKTYAAENYSWTLSCQPQCKQVPENPRSSSSCNISPPYLMAGPVSDFMLTFNMTKATPVDLCDELAKLRCELDRVPLDSLALGLAYATEALEYVTYLATVFMFCR